MNYECEFCEIDLFGNHEKECPTKVKKNKKKNKVHQDCPDCLGTSGHDCPICNGDGKVWLLLSSN